MESLPVEILRMILRRACYPLTEDLMSKHISERIFVIIEAKPVPNRRFGMTGDQRRKRLSESSSGANLGRSRNFWNGNSTEHSIVLTCHKWAIVGLPILYDYISVRINSDPLLSTPIPFASLNDVQVPYGHLIRTVDAGEFETSQAIELLRLCPNLVSVRGLTLSIWSASDWALIRSLLTQLRRLEALQLYVDAEPFNLAEHGADFDVVGPNFDDGSNEDNEPFFELPTPRPRLSSLRIFESNLGCTRRMSNVLADWELPSLQYLCYHGHNHWSWDVNADALSTFLAIHGSKLRGLSIDGQPPASSSLLSLPTLCPNLIEFAVLKPWLLCTDLEFDSVLSYHHTLVEITFAHFEIDDLVARDYEWSILKDPRGGLECIRRSNFPMLEKVYARELTVVDLDDYLEDYGPTVKLSKWWKTLMEGWEEENIKFISRRDNNEVPLSLFCDKFLFEE
ncbi:hypothetical protein SISSUDRAFT_1127294 [Sistotremastrum suecicum HHB10207 ss-3]|uniref:F-box domain-containing protein n=1 Tax=Sistotremastrum suecicum HHB10207 ss-3 TaxID=1314776 RepID=A0A166F8Z3_9AGAM|nr:hypothetical protein SISSUDRAFT_1127294 [Sistotremastrum suecicum HHB10207 ss-3]